jgi:hypothetical protein
MNDRFLHLRKIALVRPRRNRRVAIDHERCSVKQWVQAERKADNSSGGPNTIIWALVSFFIALLIASVGNSHFLESAHLNATPKAVARSAGSVSRMSALDQSESQASADLNHKAQEI